MRKTSTLILALALFVVPTSSSAKTTRDKLLWDVWYTITLNKKIHYGYYNERVELKGDRLSVQTKAWKKEEGFINDEQVGAFAVADQALTPLFYNYHANYRAQETNIDGTVGENRFLTVKIKKGGNDIPPMKRVITSHATFSSFFPVWLGYHLPKMKTGEDTDFFSVLEDNVDKGFAPVATTVRLEKADDYATAHHAFRISVMTDGVKSYWWIDKKGAALKIETPETRTLMERVAEKKARAFLNE